MTAEIAPIGLIVGSGLQDLSLFEDRREHDVETAFGKPSAPLITARLQGVSVVLVRRHGIGHRVSPSEINVRANVAALKQFGVRQVLSLSAVGSLDEAAPPGTFVMIDQFIDRTSRRVKTFFETGLVGHVAFGEPVCERMRTELAAASVKAGIPTVNGGTYVVMEGPQFSTRAESNLHRAWGGTIIGMTAMPEAKLCREAELCYALVAMVTDFDCWNDAHAHVTAETVSQVMKANSDKVGRLLTLALPNMSRFTELCPHGCERALDGAIMTAHESRDPQVVARLSSVMARSLLS